MYELYKKSLSKAGVVYLIEDWYMIAISKYIRNS